MSAVGTAPAPPAAAVPSDGKLPAGPLDAQSREAFAPAFEDLEKLGKDDGLGEPEPHREAPPERQQQQPAKSQAQLDRERDEKGKFLPKSKEPDKAPAMEPEKAPDKGEPTPKDTLDWKTAPKHFREAHEELRRKQAAIEKEYGELKTKAATPPEDPEKKALTEKYSAAEKRLAQLDEELRYTNYERSQEFKDKYEKPFVEAWMKGRAKMGTMDIIERKNEDSGEVTQQGRPATAEDFDALMAITDERAFRRQVKQMFEPEVVAEIINSRDRVKDLLESKTNALDQFRKEGSEREKTRQAELEKHHAAIKQTWDTANKTAVEKFPQWFAPEDDDPKGNELLEKGFHMADRAFSNGQPIRQGDKPLSPVELTRLQSALRNKAAGFDRLVHKFDALKKTHDELAAKLKGYEESEPGPGEGKRGTQPASEAAEGDALSAFDKQFGR